MEALIQASKDVLNCYSLGKVYLDRIEGLVSGGGKVVSLNLKNEYASLRFELSAILATGSLKYAFQNKNFLLSDLGPEDEHFIVSALAYNVATALVVPILTKGPVDLDRLESDLSESLQAMKVIQNR